MPTRRQFLELTGLTAAATMLGPSVGSARAEPVTGYTFEGLGAGSGRYDYFPFQVPSGVNRIDVRITKADNELKTGLGLFDQRGSQYQVLRRPNGFRGLYGEERGEFFVAADSASQSFIPASIEPGEWTVIVPIFRSLAPTPYTVTVGLSYGPQPASFVLGPEVGVVLDEPGWYRGDLHAHTPASSDAFASGSAMSPAQWARECRRIGLDFLALTDHNVVDQNFGLADAAAEGGGDVLLMAGEEMTNFFHGHATVSGITPGDWFDWRQRPGLSQLTPDERATARRADPRTGDIAEFMEAARAAGGYITAAHPLAPLPGLPWMFFPEGDADPAARADAVEVWTGPFQPDDQLTLEKWDQMLSQGQRVVANGGSDLHGTRNNQGFFAGTPTTIVHAPRLAKRDIVEALRAGRSFVTKRPDGVELYLSGMAAGGQRQIVGGTLFGAPTDVVDLEIVVRRAAGMRLHVIRDGAVTQVTPITNAEQRFTVQMPIGAGGYVRTEVHGEPFFAPPSSPLASTLDMEALTNALFLVLGPVPDGTVPDQTQPPAQPGPRRTDPGGPTPVIPEAPVALLLPLAAAGVAATVARRRAGRATQMTLSEFRFRVAAGGEGLEQEVTLVGELTAYDDAPDSDAPDSGVGQPAATLTRDVPGCCGADVPVEVTVLGLPPATPQSWWRVTGRWTGAGEVLRARLADPVTEPPARREA